MNPEQPNAAFTTEEAIEIQRRLLIDSFGSTERPEMLDWVEKVSGRLRKVFDERLDLAQLYRQDPEAALDEIKGIIAGFEGKAA